ncbi:hypothetical protein HZS_5260, partial [Henneguya salminicola]
KSPMKLLCVIFCFSYWFIVSDSFKKLIIISIDGFRSDFLSKETTPNLFELSKSGTVSQNLRPVFPSKTFPNHHTISTGLFPSLHGIVNNKILALNSEYNNFSESFSKGSVNPFWWNPKNNLVPIYIANQIHNDSHHSATVDWPGSGVDYNGRTTYSFKKDYIHSLPASVRLNEALAHYNSDLINLIMVYLDDIDLMAHLLGPETLEVKQKLKEVDALLGPFLTTVLSNGQTDVMIVSDHGFRTLEAGKKISSHDLFKDLEVNVIGDGAIVSLYPNEFNGLEDLHKKSEILAVELTKIEQPDKYKVYLKEDLPTYLHYSDSDRIPPIVIIMKNGYYYYKKERKRQGDHGWSVQTDTKMRAIFIAIGPSFYSGKTIECLHMTDIYMIACHVLKIQDSCHPNNGNPQILRKMIKSYK